MDRKINVLFLYINYPLAMGTYFRHALERREDVDVRVVGPYSGAFIPWLGGMNLPNKYAKPGDIDLPYPPMGREINYDYIDFRLNGWQPDLILTADAGICWKTKPHKGIIAHIATDPHVLDYSLPRSYSDKFFNMQKVYSQPSDIWLPYAYDPTVWYRAADRAPDVDACLVGMPYPQRIEWVERLQRKGVKVLFENGPVFEEARAMYQRASIGLNWSSMLDLNARVFELMAMGLCPVINRVPDLPELFQENLDYLGFSGLDEAVEKVLWAKEHVEESKTIAAQAHEAVKLHTYDARIQQIFEECNLVPRNSQSQ